VPFTIGMPVKWLTDFILFIQYPYIMRKLTAIAFFSLMVIGLTLTSCKQKEICPAYGDVVTEQVEENIG